MLLLFNTNINTLCTSFPDKADIAADVIRQIEIHVLKAQDNLSLPKIEQARAANAHRLEDPVFKEGEEVLLSILNRRREYMQKGDNQVAKFMARYDGPYKIKHVYPDTSTYTLDLPTSMKIFLTFHGSMLKHYTQSNDTLFSSRRFERPAPIVTEDGVKEWFVDCVLNRRRRGRGYRWLV